MIDKTLHERTIEYLSALKTDSKVQESDYHEILAVLCKDILEEDVEKIDSKIEEGLQSKQKCSSCREMLESWEKEICGPCKINDPKFADESDE